MTPDEIRFVRSMDARQFVAGSAQRRLLDILQRQTANYEQKRFLEAVETYTDGK